MKILAIETATEACSAALSIDGEVQEQYQVAPRQHSELILSMADTLMHEADLAVSQLDAVAFGRGPGSFIGLRIAAGVVQGIAFSADLPVLPVSSLAALAQGSTHDRVLAALDARMGEVYWATFQRVNGLVERLNDEAVSPVVNVGLPDIPNENSPVWHGVGSAWRVHGPNLGAHLQGVAGYEAEVFPRARDVITLAVDLHIRGEAVSAEQAQPIYLRDDVAKKSRESK